MIHGLNNSYLYTAKRLTALITDGNLVRWMEGTGFFVKKQDKLILVTNRHMIEPEYANAKLNNYYISQLKIGSYQSFDSEKRPLNYNTGTIQNIKDFVVADNPLNDVACLLDPRIEFGEMKINAWIDYNMLADKTWFDSKLSVCDSIAYPGFPKWFDRKNNTPIFRMGTIASDPRFDYACLDSEKADGTARVAYEGFSSGGASGSPVFSVQKGFPIGGGISAPEDFYNEVKLIGVNAGHYETIVEMDSECGVDNWSENRRENVENDEVYANEIKDAKIDGVVGHSGISYFYKSTVILDMIDRLC